MPHPFTWTPAAGERHASADPVPGPGHEYPGAIEVTTLCGREVITEQAEIPWLWPTCPGCDDQARTLVGVPPRTDVATPTDARTTTGKSS